MSALPIASAPADEKTGKRVRRSLTRLGRTLARAGRRTRKRGDEEAVHDVRVAVRRLTSALSVWRDWLRDRPRGKAVRRLRRLRREIGPTREFEVHVRALEAMAGEPSFVLKMAIGDLLASLEPELRRARRDAADACERRIPRIVRKVRRAAKAGPTARDGAEAVRLARIAARSRQAIAGALGSDDDAELHAVRIAVKKWRYALEAEEHATEVPAGALASSLRSVQKVLGAVHDHATLSARLATETERLREQGQTTQAAALSAAIAKLGAERRRGIDGFQALAAQVLRPPQAGPAAGPAAER